MTLPFLREFKLAGEDGDGRWPCLNDDGAFLSEGVALLEWDTQGLWRTRPREALQRLLETGYGEGIDAGRRIDALASVARALNAGDKARAAMTLVHAGLPALDDTERARKLAAADALLKYSPDQPRVPAGNRDGGQWSGGSGSARFAQVEPPFSTEFLDQLPRSLQDAYRATGKLPGTERGLPPEGVEPPIEGPFRPGLPSRSSEAAKGGKSLYDSKGGEWRWFPGDSRHNPHWDFKPGGSPNAPWQNIPWAGTSPFQA